MAGMTDYTGVSASDIEIGWTDRTQYWTTSIISSIYSVGIEMISKVQACIRLLF